MILQAWLTLPSCFANSSTPTLPRMIFCSRVIAGSTCVGPASTPRLPAGQSPPLNPCLSDQVDTFTQYLRVVFVALAASVVARLWVDTSNAAAPPVVWFPSIDLGPFLQTL